MKTYELNVNGHLIKAQFDEQNIQNIFIPLLLSLIHISEPTRQAEISYAVFCLKKKKQKINK